MKSHLRIALLFILALSSNTGFAGFVSTPPLVDAVSNSVCILHVHVIEETGPFKTSELTEVWGNKKGLFKLCRCRVMSRLKVSDHPHDKIHKGLDELFIACPADEQFGTLTKGDESIVFCIAGGFVPTVLNGGYIYEVNDGKVTVSEKCLPDGDPKSKEWRSMLVRDFAKMVRDANAKQKD